MDDTAGVSLKKFFAAWLMVFCACSFNLCAASVQLGDRGGEVAEVQRCLIAQGMLDGTADGVCGEKTVRAIKDFQEAVGLRVDGVCGAETFALLRAAAYDEIDITELMTGNPISKKILKPGDKGLSVENLQSSLAELGFFYSAVDGVYGSDTSAAVKRFQSENDLYASGICNEQTLAALKKFDADIYDPNPEEESKKFKRSLYVEATAYSIHDAGLNSYTATGKRVRRGIVAVDPNVIPLGTRLYIPGYGEAFAEDTGGEIIGNKIDIAFDTREEALNFGRRMIEIYILED